MVQQLDINCTVYDHFKLSLYMYTCVSPILTFINLIITTLLQNYFVTLTYAGDFNMVVLAFWES